MSCNCFNASDHSDAKTSKWNLVNIGKRKDAQKKIWPVRHSCLCCYKYVAVMTQPWLGEICLICQRRKFSCLTAQQAATNWPSRKNDYYTGVKLLKTNKTTIIEVLALWGFAVEAQNQQTHPLFHCWKCFPPAVNIVRIWDTAFH